MEGAQPGGRTRGGRRTLPRRGERPDAHAGGGADRTQAREARRRPAGCAGRPRHPGGDGRVPAYGYLVVDTTEDGQVGFDGATIVGNLFALWTGEGSPTRQGCTALSSTKGETRINTARGRLICLETSEARTALLKVKSFLDGTVAARAVVWETQP